MRQSKFNFNMFIAILVIAAFSIVIGGLYIETQRELNTCQSFYGI